MGMVIDFNEISEEQKKEHFYAFISSAIVSREDMSQHIDLSRLDIKLTLNGQEVDLIRAWGLFTQFTGSLNREQPSNSEEVVEKILSLRKGMVSEAARIQEARTQKLQELRDNITERILDDVREAVSDAVNYHHVYDHLYEAFTTSNCVDVEREFNSVDEVDQILSDLAGGSTT